METVEVDFYGEIVKVTRDDAAALTRFMESRARLDAEVAAESARADRLEGELEVAKQRVTQLEAEVTTRAAERADAFPSLVARRAELIATAERVVGASPRPTGKRRYDARSLHELDDREIMARVVKHVVHTDITAGDSAERLAGMYEVAVNTFDKRRRDLAEVQVDRDFERDYARLWRNN